MKEKTFNREVNNKMWEETMDTIYNKELLGKDKENIVTTTISFHQDIELCLIEFMYDVRKNYGIKLNKKEALSILLMKGLNVAVKEEMTEDGESIIDYYRRSNNLNFRTYLDDKKAELKKLKKESKNEENQS